MTLLSPLNGSRRESKLGNQRGRDRLASPLIPAADCPPAGIVAGGRQTADVAFGAVVVGRHLGIVQKGKQFVAVLEQAFPDAQALVPDNGDAARLTLVPHSSHVHFFSAAQKDGSRYNCFAPV